jgi:hypothetical protein
MLFHTGDATADLTWAVTLLHHLPILPLGIVKGLGWLLGPILLPSVWSPG